jgi:hypothetical protein
MLDCSFHNFFFSSPKGMTNLGRRCFLVLLRLPNFKMVVCRRPYASQATRGALTPRPACQMRRVDAIRQRFDSTANSGISGFFNSLLVLETSRSGIQPQYDASSKFEIIGTDLYVLCSGVHITKMPFKWTGFVNRRPPGQVNQVANHLFADITDLGHR